MGNAIVVAVLAFLAVVSEVWLRRLPPERVPGRSRLLREPPLEISASSGWSPLGASASWNIPRPGFTADHAGFGNRGEPDLAPRKSSEALRPPVDGRAEVGGHWFSG